MEIQVYEPKMVRSTTLPYEEVRILPIGDIQYGAPGCDVDQLREHIKWGVKNKCYFIGMGDYLDVASPSNRKLLAQINSGLYESVRQMMDEKMNEQVEELYKILRPTKGRWLGMVQGHHLWNFEAGDTSDSRLAARLGASLLGDCGLVIVNMVKEVKHTRGGRSQKRQVQAKIWIHHGQGSGQTIGASLNKLSNITRTFDADIYLMGHFHRANVAKETHISYELQRNGEIKVVNKNRYLVTTGGFLKAFEVGTKDARGQPAGGYVEKAMLTPTALGGAIIYLRPFESHGSHTRLDINVSI